MTTQPPSHAKIERQQARLHETSRERDAALKAVRGEARSVGVRGMACLRKRG